MTNSLALHTSFYNILQRLLLTLLLGLAGFAPLWGEHLVGGGITYECLGEVSSGQYRYQITMEVYRDCRPGLTGFDPEVALFIYNATNNQLAQTVVVNLGPTSFLPITSTDTCVDPPTNICYARALYTTQVLLSANPGGYHISWQRCCRNQTIVNIFNPGTQGITLTAYIPNTTYCNNSPEFNNFAPTFLCSGDMFEFDHSATDPDGDSLVYSISTPYTGGSVQAPVPPTVPPPPYTNVVWQNPFNLNNIMGGTPPLNIDPQTGMLSAFPNNLGQYVMTVSVREYRNGDLLSEVRRDIQMNVISCPINFPPQINVLSGGSTNGDTLYFLAGEEECFTLQVTDVNGAGIPQDMLSFSASGDLLGGGSLPPPYGSFTAQTGFSPITGELCWTPDCGQSGSISTLDLRAEDSNTCPEPNVTIREYIIKVIPGDATPPELRCVSVEGPNSIRLNWQKPAASQLTGFDSYYIYRNDGSGWVNAGIVNNQNTTSFTDNSAVNAYNQSYCYQLATAKICPGFFVGTPGNEVCSILADAVAISQSEGRVTWDAYTGWANPTYTVLANDGTETALASGLTETQYTYLACDPFQGTFRVSVKDPLTGCTAYSAPSPEIELEDLPPTAVDLCRVSVIDGNKGILVEWEMSPDDDFFRYRLYRRKGNSGDELVFNSGNVSVISFIDSTADVEEASWCYRLEVEDLCGNVFTTDRDCSVFLRGEGDTENYELLLEWSPYSGWPEGVQNNEIWNINATSGDGLVETLGPGTLEYSNLAALDGEGVFCFRIRATQTGTYCGVESWSNELCVSFPPVLYLPNAFSPNDDNINDYFEVKGLFVQDYHLMIFNRWGKLMFESTNLSDIWDGRFNGRFVPEGVYVYTMELTGFEGQEFQRSGSITLVR